MRYLILIVLSLLLYGCATAKKPMKNCVKTGEVIWECENL